MRHSSAAAVLAIGLAALALCSPGHAPGQQSGGTPVPQPPQDPFFSTASSGSATNGQNDPELEKLLAGEAEAAREVAKLTKEYAKTEDADERKKIKEKLSAAISKQFDQQQKRRELELKRAEDQLKKVRALMKKRDEDRKSIIDKRLDQLVREAEGLGWSPPPSQRSQQNDGNFAPVKPASVYSTR